tara:strand:- start:37 stop:243 length:207 start_codon:yes stop_codon:yes gene_type:complete
LENKEREKEKGKKLVLSKKGKKMNPLLKLNSKDDERVFLKREMNYIIFVIVVFIMNSNKLMKKNEFLC